MPEPKNVVNEPNFDPFRSVYPVPPPTTAPPLPPLEAHWNDLVILQEVIPSSMRATIFPTPHGTTVLAELMTLQELIRSIRHRTTTGMRTDRTTVLTALTKLQEFWTSQTAADTDSSIATGIMTPAMTPAMIGDKRHIEETNEANASVKKLKPNL